MSWWRPFREPLSDDAIAERVAAMVAEGEIKAEMAPHIERALRDEAAGKCVIMRNPGIKPKPPRRPSWESHPDRGHDDVANAVAGAAALSKFGGYDTSLRWVSGDDDDWTAKTLGFL